MGKQVKPEQAKEGCHPVAHGRPHGLHVSDPTANEKGERKARNTCPITVLDAAENLRKNPRIRVCRLVFMGICLVSLVSCPI